MQTPIHPDEPQGTAPGAGVGAQVAALAALPSTAGPADLIYDLRQGCANSDGYYAGTARFAGTLLDQIETRAGSLLDNYSLHVVDTLREAVRGRGEYGIDLLMLGMALRLYASAAESAPAWAVTLAQEFFWMRRESKLLKPFADLGRAAVCRFILAPRMSGAARVWPCPPEGLPRLIDWMQATGEFEQETRRLNNWRSYLGTLPRPEACLAMEVAVEAFDWFQEEAALALGPYTAGVEKFLATVVARRGLREDQLFCGKRPVEYHLAMVAAEVMNRGLLEQFEQTQKRAVLVPACMRGAHARTCKAKVFGPDIVCAACDPHCAVNRITRELGALGAKVYLVPHATGFSRWLERWQREPETGVVAVACLLNILPGGYEMRARRIPAQCVLLDYPGCQKHWRRKGIPTGLNEERLVQIATMKPLD